MVPYEIVRHEGRWAVCINGTVYNSADKFAQDFPKDQFGDVRFGCEMDFSWQEMYNDMLSEWGA